MSERIAALAGCRDAGRVTVARECATCEQVLVCRVTDAAIFTPNASKATDAAGIPAMPGDDSRCVMLAVEGYRGGRGPGYHGTVTDIGTGTKWKVYGAPCGAGCYCAARVVRVAVKGGR